MKCLSIYFILLTACSSTLLIADEKPDNELAGTIKDSINLLKSKKSEERIKGAETLGTLGEKAKQARRALCAAMLDKNTKVQVAAVDALKLIDRGYFRTLFEPARIPEFQACQSGRIGF